MEIITNKVGLLNFNHKKRILSTKKRVKYTLKEIKKNKVSYLFIAPYVIIFSIFTIAPVLISMYLGFTTFNILEPPKFVGLENYVRLFLDDDLFMLAITNTFVLAAITGPLSYILCFILAWFINELRPKIRALVTLIFYAPSISGNIFLIWKVMFSGDTYGYANAWLLKWGIISEPILWFINPEYMVTLVIIVALWASLGTSFLAFIAGFQGVNKVYYEAGAVDGISNRWQELWFITMPLMKPQMMFGAVMSITASFGIGTLVTVLVGFPSTDYAVHTILNHLEDYGSIRFEMGYASAIATIMFIIMIVTNLIVKKLLSKVGE